MPIFIQTLLIPKGKQWEGVNVSWSYYLYDVVRSCFAEVSDTAKQVSEDVMK